MYDEDSLINMADKEVHLRSTLKFVLSGLSEHDNKNVFDYAYMGLTKLARTDVLPTICRLSLELFVMFTKSSKLNVELTYSNL